MNTTDSKAFTKEEITRILDVFDRDYPTYSDYVRFRFMVGARSQEINDLKWADIAVDFSTIRFHSKKTTKARLIKTNAPVRELLERIGRGADDSLVFTTVEGKRIHTHLFSSRYWNKALSVAGVAQKRPYRTRNSYISHSLTAGVAPPLVAAQAGHSLKVMFDVYADCIATTELTSYL